MNEYRGGQPTGGRMSVLTVSYSTKFILKRGGELEARLFTKGWHVAKCTSRFGNDADFFIESTS